MSFGFKNRVLRINLTDGKATVEEPGEKFYRKLLGGRAIVGWYLNKEVSGDCDPFGPDNKVIIATSVLTGSPVPGTSRFSVGSKSPITEGFADSEAGGFFGPELKFAGYDAVIVEGKSPKPCYIAITNEKVEIRDASQLWGKETGPVQEAIREEMGDKRVRVLQTGPGGERLIRFAGLTNDLKHWNGRGGHGAVFGSKNLRAIAVRGKDKDMIKYKEDVKKYAKWFAVNWKNHEALPGFAELGTSQNVAGLDGLGILPTENFKKGSFEQAEAIDGVKMTEDFKVKREGCYACPVDCKQVVANKSEDKSKNVDPIYGGPEYETLGAMGACCGIGDLLTICKGNELVGRYGLDSISTGMVIAFAMECFENGIITKEDTGGLELKFGNSEALLQMIEMIVNREGIGDVLAEGSYRAARKIGKGAEKFALTSKKLELPAHDPRGKWNIGLGYAVTPNGADHIVVGHDHCFMGPANEDPGALAGANLYSLYRFGIREPMEPVSLDHNKLRAFVVLQKIWSLCDTLDVCIFLCEVENRMITLEHFVELINNMTGWDLSFYEMMRASERGIVMGRLFNKKCGITAKDETLPERMFEPIENGIIEGTAIDREAFENAKELYYQMTGMDKDGTPLYGKIVELELEELWD